MTVASPMVEGNMSKFLILIVYPNPEMRSCLNTCVPLKHVTTISVLRVLSDRIPRVLVFVYFCRRLSGNTEERPTRRVYIELLTCHTIFYHLEDSRSQGNEREAKRAQG